MSMSEFDQQLNNEGNDNLSLTVTEQEVPPDFGEDDLIFAHELNSIFSPEQEELPPYFVQTLLASEDQLFQPVELGFEHKTRARVFRRLKLHRRLFHSPQSLYDTFITGITNIHARGSLFISALVFMFIMAVTVAFTAPSFASGMTILLQGAHSGVFQVNTYPKSVHVFRHKHRFTQSSVDNWPGEIALPAAQQQLQFKIYWPLSLPRNYVLSSIYLIHGVEGSWSNGPIVELVYSLNGVKSKGTGQIVIREFMPNEDVLQVVQDKSVHPIDVNQFGQPAAIYVNGQWQDVGKFSHKWIYGERSELIYQQNGILFWIAGDQFDGIGEKELWTLAQSMRTISFNHYMLLRSEMPDVTQTYLDSVLDPFSQDTVRIFLDDNPGSAYYLSVSSSQSPVPLAPQIGTHGH
ncbi:MAG TPA: hypothetical protein VED37_14865 [Ktedonobacteraceae bacterium]|nr:hypothetical protein [Ktedonobacteraceae bacterium]